MAEKVAGDELAQMLGQNSETVTIAGKPVTVSPFRLKQLSDALRCVQSLAEAGIDVQPFAQNADTDDPKIGLKRDFNFLKALLNGGDPVIELLAIGSGMSGLDIGNLLPDEAVALGAAIWRVNHDFFVQRGPAIKSALGPVWDLIDPLVKIAGQPESLALFFSVLTQNKSENSQSINLMPSLPQQPSETSN